MQILGTDAYRTRLSSSLIASERAVSIISAYITIEGLDWILERLPASVKCRVIARWNCSDLVSGASDLEVFERLRDRNYSFFILQDLHAKLALVDGKDLFIGSSNITNAGLKLVPGGNRELGTILLATDGDILVVDTVFQEGTLITDEIYAMLKAEVDDRKDIEKTKPCHPNWSVATLKVLGKAPERLWVAELPWSSSPASLLSDSLDLSDENTIHDLNLYGFELQADLVIDDAELRFRFRVSRAWRWIERTILNTEDRELYFGELSSILHNSFLDDPKPYRKDVKELLSNLLGWGSELCSDVLVVDRPNYSQRIKVIRG